MKQGVFFKVWAPRCKQVDVLIERQRLSPFRLRSHANGFHSGLFPGLEAGALYKFRLNHKHSYPDPVSRYQPEGPHGPSMVIDPTSYRWKDQSWQRKGIRLQGQVFYEVHVGAFTAEGTFAAMVDQLAALKKLGITAIELMPLAEFPGRWNWGYDGVNLFAPAHVYGAPDDLRRLVDAAHRQGMAMVLDVVYNHFGPDGNYLKFFSPDYFTRRYKTDWGEAINFDGKNAAQVRQFFLQNAAYWIKEFHFDGLRLDATQNIYDQGKPHILAEITKTVRAAASPKKVLLIGENEPQEVRLLKSPAQGGYGLDSLWNDDFHHTAYVRMTGRREAYYTDYLGHAQEFISMVKRGFMYQGQFYSWQNQPRGTYVDDQIPASAFTVYLENHDQVANSLYGLRMAHQTDIALYRALTALFLLGPQTPLIFMGQEFAASTPFLFFTDHDKELGPLVFKGRKEFLCQFPSIAAAVHKVQDPQDAKAFTACKLKFEERRTHKEIYALHADLLKIRREDDVIKRQDHQAIEGAVFTQDAFVLRYKHKEAHRLLVVNFGDDVHFVPVCESLLAPLPHRPWAFLWSSEDPKYGGRGKIQALTQKGWSIPGRCAQLYG